MKYFKLEEFESPNSPGSGEEMKQLFLNKLDVARGYAGIPFIINSGFRTVDHNVSVKGSLNSSHLRGYAADIHCLDSRSRKIIVNALINAGLNRIGIAKTFIHVDCDPEKSQDVIWLY